MDSSVGNKLGNNWTVAVYLVLEEGVEVLMVSMVWHDNQEDKLGVFHLSARFSDLWEDLLVVVVLNALSEGVQKIFFVVGGLVWHWADISIFNLDVETLRA